MSKTLALFTLHEDEQDFCIRGSVLARSPREAASILGGEFMEVENWPPASSTNRDELNFVGKVRFAPELFRSHTPEELSAIKLDYDPGPYYERGPGLLLWQRGGKGVELVLRLTPISLPEYV